MRSNSIFVIIFVSVICVADINISYSAEVIKAGPISITPISVTSEIKKHGENVLFRTTVRLKIENTSSSDISIVMFARTISGIDNLDEKILSSTGGGAWVFVCQGVFCSDSRDIERAFIQEKQKFVRLAPGQPVELHITPESPSSFTGLTKDLSGDVYKTHRPSSISISGTFGIIKIDNSTETRSFTLSNVPLRLLVK